MAVGPIAVRSAARPARSAAAPVAVGSARTPGSAPAYRKSSLKNVKPAWARAAMGCCASCIAAGFVPSRTKKVRLEPNGVWRRGWPWVSRTKSDEVAAAAVADVVSTKNGASQIPALSPEEVMSWPIAAIPDGNLLLACQSPQARSHPSSISKSGRPAGNSFAATRGTRARTSDPVTVSKSWFQVYQPPGGRRGFGAGAGCAACSARA